MSIWFNPSLSVADLESYEEETMNQFIGIQFTEVGQNYLKARMEVDHRTRQAYGILHGGASVTLAETVGSIGSAMVIDQSKFYCVGVEINANHVRSIKQGFVEAKAEPLHLGNSTHIWDVKITDEKERLICICRLTVFILSLRSL